MPPDNHGASLDRARAILSTYSVNSPVDNLIQFKSLYNSLDTRSKVKLWQNDYSPKTITRFAKGLVKEEWGLAFLINLRADILRNIKSPRVPNVPTNLPISDLLKNVISGPLFKNLSLQILSPDSPSELLNKIIKYEAVHPIPSMSHLHQRMGPNRRIYSFLHPRIPTEPLCFVEVAFTDRISDNIKDIIDENITVDNTNNCNTAVFYSINSPQKGKPSDIFNFNGLSGIDLGASLLKQTLDQLSQTDPQITTFTTLSPIPSFHSWLIHFLVSNSSKSVRQVIPTATENLQGWGDVTLGEVERILECRGWLNETKSGVPNTSVETKRSVKDLLMSLCRHYIVNVKSGGPNSGAFDPVEKGLLTSYSIMANYLYHVPSLSLNSQKYVENGTVVECQNIKIGKAKL
ncbi:malonyl-CoA decarboxylase-domain-containing protein [Paraphysoderma sedebokerense]|nr:malonyl-CoA decarboxylase-domain-containing protein [Paraphysoderma sedebokerense]